jgi:elongation factor 1-beta
MAQVLAVVKIFPKSIETNLESLKDEVRKALTSDFTIHSFNEEPIAFGLVALIANILMEDSTGKIDRMESSINDLADVSQIEVTRVMRI